jgi:hypothetical protein
MFPHMLNQDLTYIWRDIHAYIQHHDCNRGTVWGGGIRKKGEKQRMMGYGKMPKYTM